MFKVVPLCLRRIYLGCLISPHGSSASSTADGCCLLAAPWHAHRTDPEFLCWCLLFSPPHLNHDAANQPKQYSGLKRRKSGDLNFRHVISNTLVNIYGPVLVPFVFWKHLYAKNKQKQQFNMVTRLKHCTTFAYRYDLLVYWLSPFVKVA